ncbi:hypothetical protein GCM10017779_62160 [Streptomyces capillispiralis]|nr:hypothetical protein GCM10017779_62160 [Streptomyces capillispiralis]
MNPQRAGIPGRPWELKLVTAPAGDGLDDAIRAPLGALATAPVPSAARAHPVRDLDNALPDRFERSSSPGRPAGQRPPTPPPTSAWRPGMRAARTTPPAPGTPPTTRPPCCHASGRSGASGQPSLAAARGTQAEARNGLCPAESLARAQACMAAAAADGSGCPCYWAGSSRQGR